MKDAIYIEVDKLLKRIENLYDGSKRFTLKSNFLIANDTLNKTSDDIDSLLQHVITDEEQNHRLQELLGKISDLKQVIKNGIKNLPPAALNGSSTNPTNDSASSNESSSREDTNSRVEQLASSSDYTIITDTGVTFDDVIGCDEIKAFINQDWIFRFNPQFQKVHLGNKEYPLFDPKSMERGLLFYGLPGTGKTMMAKAIATKVKATFFSIDASQLLDKYKGGTVQRMKQLFEEASKYERAIIFIDEIDSILTKPSDSTEQHAKQDLNQWLALMNGINSNKKYDRLLFIGTTNFPNSIAPSALRPGRFGLHFRIDIPDLKTRYSLIQRLISKDPLFTELLGFMDLKRAAVMTAGYTQADITALFGRLLNLVKSKIISALVKRIENNDPKPSHFQSHDFMISQAEVDQFIQTSHKTSTESSLQDLQKFEEEFNIKPLTGGIKEHYDTLLKEGNI